MYCNTSSGAHDAFAIPSSRATPIRRPVGQCGVVHTAAPGRGGTETPRLDPSDLANLVRKMRTKPRHRSAVPPVIEQEPSDEADCLAIAKVTECPRKFQSATLAIILRSSSMT
ncbi:hypothetical protein LSAT2_015808 [Lamellibrachia satsuma]|nr:hypothetical protein LSAT2_015808 [Lamellibrachia satsuma]